MKEIPILKWTEILPSRSPNELISLNRLKMLTGDNTLQLKELVAKAVESMEIARAEVQQACMDNNYKKLLAAIHKITPLFNYLEAETVLDVMSTCVQNLLGNDHSDESYIAYQIILKNLDAVLKELTDKNKAIGTSVL